MNIYGSPTKVEIRENGKDWTEIKAADFSWEGVRAARRRMGAFAMGPILVTNMPASDDPFFFRADNPPTPQEAAYMLGLGPSIRERFAMADAAIRASPGYISPRRAARRAHRKQLKRSR